MTVLEGRVARSEGATQMWGPNNAETPRQEWVGVSQVTSDLKAGRVGEIQDEDSVWRGTRYLSLFRWLPWRAIAKHWARRLSSAYLCWETSRTCARVVETKDAEIPGGKRWWLSPQGDAVEFGQQWYLILRVFQRFSQKDSSNRLDVEYERV